MDTVGELIQRNAHFFPDVDAFISRDRSVTYKDYATRCRQLANRLHDVGMRHQDRVGVLSTNNIEYYEIFGACELSGFIAALYNFRSAAPEIQHLLKDSQPSVVVFEHTYAELIDGLREQFPDVYTWVCIGGEVPEWAVGFEQFLAQGAADVVRSQSCKDDIAYLFYTSGTTGKPKGVPFSHESALQSARLEGRRMGSGGRFMQASPAYHLGGKGYPLGILWMGGTLVLYPGGFDAETFAKLIEKERITDTFMVPMMMLAVLDYLDENPVDISSLRSVSASSTAIPAAILRRAIAVFGPVFYVSYGSTEAGNICSLMKHELMPDGPEKMTKRLASVGHFEPENTGAILDENDQPCAIGEVGEICLRRPEFRGYWNNSAATIEATRNGWLHTGDLGYQDEEGYVFLVDRKKDMIISGGENIYSREVEDVVISHPDVREAAVIGVPDEKWGEVVKAVVVLVQGSTINEADLIAYCQQQIARFKCPKIVVFVSQLPLLPNGKIDKKQLR